MFIMILKRLRYQKSNNKIGKFYRIYRVDIWGNLARRRRYDFMTTLVSKFAQQFLKQKLAGYTRLEKRRVLRMFPKKPVNPNAFMALEKFVKPERSRARGRMMKARKVLSLFYDRRLKVKAWRRFGKATHNKAGHRAHSFGARLEHRCDVLLVRCCFVDSIFDAKARVRANGVKITGQTIVTNPAYCLRPYQIFTIKQPLEILRAKIYTNLQKDTLLCKPEYLWIHYGLLFAFLIENVNPVRVCYPFLTSPGYLGGFRKSFAVLYT